MIFDNLIDVKTGEPVEIDYEVEGMEAIEKVAREAGQEAGKRLRKVFGRGKTVTNEEKQL